ncbi:hypothetical protein B0T11DRAFT_129951 [Plectosphaerella cucumerina]|uniref:C2H2-type domain-containing protein n=1 Tax=Plectosphaerella cucumerina TaxID=40658 RepID=A0A8K0WYV3_9PEZI|nr:hypothetical protein B0T11DRAFT_129951 [Plectosphaerella cucumerina]
MTKLSQGSSPKQCPVCYKKFAQATTLKRHIYYCRSKKIEACRKKSCVSCIRAKTRCSWPAGPGEVTLCAMSSPWLSMRTDGPLGDEPAEIEVAIETVTPDVTNHSSRLDSSWDSSLTPSSQSSGGIIGFHNDQDIDSWDLMAIDSCLSALRPQSLASTALFHTRPFTRPTQTPCVSLAMRILRSYPSMMSRDGGLPPFVSPQLYSGKQQSHSRSQALSTCAKLAQQLRSPHTNKITVWEKIWFEQERISAEHSTLDRWELLAALQALLIYCLMRLKDTPIGHDAFDASLLTTVNLISSSLVASSTEVCDFDLSGDPEQAWKEWLFGESRRRTFLMFQIVNMLVDISTTVSSYAIWEFVAIPLPSPAVLWNATKLDGWSAGFEEWRKRRTLYGLSESGGLKRLKKDSMGLCLSGPAEWEDWSAETGEVGALVMMAGELL